MITYHASGLRLVVEKVWQNHLFGLNDSKSTNPHVGFKRKHLQKMYKVRRNALIRDTADVANLQLKSPSKQDK